MQNSGLGHSLNVLTPLNLIYDLHVPLIVSWRGHDGNDAVEHDTIGRELLDLLDVFGLRHTLFDPTDPYASVERCLAASEDGLSTPGPHRQGRHLTCSASRTRSARSPRSSPPPCTSPPAGSSPGTSTTPPAGPENFYLVGSMGMAAPVGLGVALARPGRHAVVLDGAGSFAMNPGALLMIAGHNPDLVHVVCDNGVHESTGGQRPVRIAGPAGMALAAGVRSARRAGDVEERRDARLRVDRGQFLGRGHRVRGGVAGKRVEWTPQQLVDRFRTAAAA
ncbi:thiamine pyrophosphate-dependent enzyme [Streptomyces californicus]|uniref:thiamine pyrophosphate-dependent enzyme n=1 Tax=Streptomyces californicus TaxID=67351 RepID=UPI0037CFA45F